MRPLARAFVCNKMFSIGQFRESCPGTSAVNVLNASIKSGIEGIHSIDEMSRIAWHRYLNVCRERRMAVDAPEGTQAARGIPPIAHPNLQYDWGADHYIGLWEREQYQAGPHKTV